MDTFNSLGKDIQDHLKQIARTSGLPQNDDSYERMALAWVEKKAAFDTIIAEHGLSEMSFFGRSEQKGALVLTWSGSILTIGPLVDGTRRCEYTSIGLRGDVPPSAVEEASELSADIETNEAVQFAAGPVRTSSPVYRLALTTAVMEPEEEEALLTQVSQSLAGDMTEINKTIVAE